MYIHNSASTLSSSASPPQRLPLRCLSTGSRRLRGIGGGAHATRAGRWEPRRRSDVMREKHCGLVLPYSVIAARHYCMALSPRGATGRVCAKGTTRVRCLGEGREETDVAWIAGTQDQSDTMENQPELNIHHPRPTGLELPVLLLVPLAWGTWSPVTRLLYQSLAANPPPTLINCAFQMISFSSLVLALLTRNAASASKASARRDDTPSAAPPRPSWNWKFLCRGGIELGTWLFIGSSLQLYGLQFTAANKAAFLVQMTTIIVPLLEGVVLGRILGRGTWAAVGIAVVGVSILSAGDLSAVSHLDEVAADGRWEVVGDACCALAAFFFSAHVIRLQKFAQALPSVELACVKAGTQVLLSTGVWAMGWALFGWWDPSTLFFTTSPALDGGTLSWVIAACVIWNGIVPSAFTVWAQSFGQRVVEPTTANLIYSLQPLWATTFAFLFLHEKVDEYTIFGGLFIVAGSILAVLSGMGPPKSNDEDSSEKVY